MHPRIYFPPGLDTPVELKLKLIPMLQHMHHDASLASSSRDLLQHLVSSYPSTSMVIVTLHTFTQLAASSLIDIPKQVTFYTTFLLVVSFYWADHLQDYIMWLGLSI